MCTTGEGFRTATTDGKGSQKTVSTTTEDGGARSDNQRPLSRLVDKLLLEALADPRADLLPEILPAPIERVLAVKSVVDPFHLAHLNPTRQALCEEVGFGLRDERVVRPVDDERSGDGR